MTSATVTATDEALVGGTPNCGGSPVSLADGSLGLTVHSESTKAAESTHWQALSLRLVGRAVPPARGVQRPRAPDQLRFAG